MTTSDPEVEAIAKIAEALEAISDPAGRTRVLNYILSRYKVQPLALVQSGMPAQTPLSSAPAPVQDSMARKQSSKPLKAKPKRRSPGVVSDADPEPDIDIAGMVHHLKHMDNYAQIQSAILKKSTMVGRLLLAIKVYEDLHSEGTGLSCKDISKFFHQFNIRIAESNVAKAIRTSVIDYVTTSGLRGEGPRMRYTLSAIGRQKLDELIQAK
ncbi:MAG TPA: hypothetical protein V6C97_01875 [Oculatellaceae cyanobacterium]